MSNTERSQKSPSTKRQPNRAGNNRLEKQASSPVSQNIVQRAFANPQQLSPTDIVSLQRTVGNHAVVQMLRQPQGAEASVKPTEESGDPNKMMDRQVFTQVWSRIEAEVGSSQNNETIYDAFMEVATEMSRWGEEYHTPISEMFDRVEEMIQDYLDGHTIVQMAANAGF